MSDYQFIIDEFFSFKVGFGLGPTLEAYSLLSKELQKNGLELWRTDSSFDSTKGYLGFL